MTEPAPGRAPLAAPLVAPAAEFHSRRETQRRTMLLQAAGAAALAPLGAIVNPIFFVFSAALAAGAGVMWWKLRDPRPHLRIDATGVSARAGAARWEQIEAWGLARFGGRTRGKDCFFVDVRPGGPEFRLRHPDQMLAGPRQLRIPLNELDPACGDPADAARAHRPELETRP